MNKHFDVVVIGGGPAGMMSAVSAAKHGAEVVLLEKNDSLGKKLLATAYIIATGGAFLQIYRM